jgi:hypothetical protein
MSDENPTLEDIWRLLGIMNRRFDGREREIVQLRQDFAGLRGELSDLKSYVNTGFGALTTSIEARDSGWMSTDGG